jgi:hypothetical protein
VESNFWTLTGIPFFGSMMNNSKCVNLKRVTQ